MSSRVCTVFPNCLPIKDMTTIRRDGTEETFSLTPYSLYALIRNYNDYLELQLKGADADKRKEIESKYIKADKSYSSEELAEIQKELIEYIKYRNNANNRNFQRKKILEKTNSSILAKNHLDNSSLTGEQKEELLNYIVSKFFSYLTELADKYHEDIDYVADNLSRRKQDLGNIFRLISEDLYNLWDDILDKLDNDPNYELTEEEESIISILEEILPSKENGYTELFLDACVSAVPIINKMLNVKLRNDFVLSEKTSNDTFYDAVENIEDYEQPQQELYQKQLDKQNFTQSLSPIVQRVLLQIPEYKTKTETKYYDTNTGKFISKAEADNIFSELLEKNRNTARKEFNKRVTVSVEVASSPVMSLFSTATYPIFKLPLGGVDSKARKLAFYLKDCISEQDMMDRLQKHSIYSQSLYGVLASNSRLKTTFFINFNRYNQQYSITSVKTDNDGNVQVSTPILGRDSVDKTLNRFFNTIKTNLFPKTNISVFVMELDDNGRKTVRSNFKNFIYLKQYFEAGKKQIDEIEKGETVGNIQKIKSDLIQTVFLSLGITIDATTANSIAQDSVNYSLFVNSANTIFDKETAFNNSKGKVLNEISNNEYLSKSFRSLLRLADPFDSSQNTTAMVSFNGSSLSTSILLSPVTSFIKKVRALSGDELTSWLKNKFLNSVQFCLNPTEQNDDNLYILNRWLRDLFRLKDTKFGTFKQGFNIQRDLGYNETDSEKLNPQEQQLMNIYEYLYNRTEFDTIFVDSDTFNNNEALKQRKTELGKERIKFAEIGGTRTKTISKTGDITIEYRKDYALIPAFTTGDNISVRLFKTLHYNIDEIVDGMYDLYLADIANQSAFKGISERGFALSANGKETATKKLDEFGIVSFLNIPEYRKRLKDITPEQIGEEITFASREAFKDLAKQYLEESFKREFLQDLVDADIIDIDDEGNITSKYFAEKAEQTDMSIEDLLRDYYMDYTFSQYNTAHLFHVSPSLFANVEDMQKRNKAILTNGYPLSAQAVDRDGSAIWGEDFSSRVVIFKDVKVPRAKVGGFVKGEEVDDLLEYSLIRAFKATGLSSAEAKRQTTKLLANFDEKDSNTLTDGQGYRLFESYYKILSSQGENQWNALHDKAYKEIMNIVDAVRRENRNMTPEEITKINNLLVAMQPIKPINDGIETWSDGNVKIGFQFKYAEIPLIPEMFPVGSKMRQMGQWMRNNGVDLMCSDKCLKKGSFGEIDIQYQTRNGKYIDESGNIIPGLDENGKEVDNPSMAQQRRYCEQKEDLRVPYGDNVSFDDIVTNQSIKDGNGIKTNFVIHVIPMDNYLVQGNIPDHSEGNSIVGTQQRKIINSAIIDDENYHYSIKIGSKTIDIDGKQLLKVFNSLYTAKYFKSFKKFLDEIEDPIKLTDDLIYPILNNSRTNPEFAKRIMLADDGKTPMVPYGELSQRRNIESNIISLFKKYVIRQLIHGGNIVQASSLGVGDKALADPTLHATFDENGNPTGMQIEAPFNFTVKDQNGNLVNLDYDTYCNPDGTFKTAEKIGFANSYLIDIHYPGIRELVGYRIPSEMEYSMYRMEVARVTPKNASNVLKLPAECTTISDFDFDIDKLFLMKYIYYIKKDPNIDTDVVWDKIYREHEEYYNRLKEARNNTSEEDKEALAKSKNKKSIQELDLHDYWELADIEEDKEALYYSTEYSMLLPNMTLGISDFDKIGGSLIDARTEDIDNMLVAITLAVLSDPSTLINRYTPGGSKNAIRSSKIIDLLKASTAEDIKDLKDSGELDSWADGKNTDKEKYNYAQPRTALAFKKKNQVAGTLIGIFANEDVNNFISQKLEKLIVKSNPFYRILFGSLQDGIIELDGNTDLNPANTTDVGYNFLHTSINGRSIKKELSSLLAASVDAVKNPILDKLNINELTADAAGLLLRLGYSTTDVGLLFNQPIIVELCNYLDRIHSTDWKGGLKTILRAKYSDKLPTSLINNIVNVDKYAIKSSLVDTKHLAEGVAGKEDMNVQLEVAKLFTKIMTIKGELSDYIQKTRNTSANSVKSTFGEYIAKEEKTPTPPKYLVIKTKDENNKEPITAWDGNLTEVSEMKKYMDTRQNHPFLYEDAVYNIVQTAMSRMIDKFTVYSSKLYTGTREVLRDFISDFSVTGEVVEDLHSFIPQYYFKTLDGDLNPKAIHDEETRRSNADYYLKRPVEIVSKIIDKIIQGIDDITPEEMAIITFLDKYGFDTTSVGTIMNGDEEVSLEVFDISLNKFYNLNKEVQQQITSDWDRLMRYSSFNEDQNGLAEEFAKAFYLHFYYTKGLNPTRNPIMELAPMSVLESIIVDKTTSTPLTYPTAFKPSSYNDEGIDFVSGEIAFNYILFHASNPKIVPRFKGSDTSVSVLEGKSVTVRDDALRKCIARVDKNVTFIKPIINVDGVLYKCFSNNGTYNNMLSGNLSQIKQITYVMIEPSESTSDINDQYFNANNGYIFNYFRYSLSTDVIDSISDLLEDNIDPGNQTEDEGNPVDGSKYITSVVTDETTGEKVCNG